MSPVYFRGVGAEEDPTKSIDPVQQPGLVMDALTSIDPIAPVIDVAQNVDGFGNPVYKEARPGESRVSKATDSPSLLKDVATVLNESWVSGGSDQISGDLDFNPDALNYLLQNYLGSSYVMFGDAAETILEASAGEATVDTWPILKKFYQQDFEYSAYGNYYDAKSVVGSYLAEFGNIEDLLENKGKPLPGRDEKIADYAAVETEPGSASKRYGQALAMHELFSDIDREVRQFKEAKDLLQEQQEELGYDMFNLEVADKWADLEEKIYRIERAEMQLMEKALKEYYKYYPKVEE